MTTDLLRKLGHQDGQRTIVLHAPPALAPALRAPGTAPATRLAGRFDVIHLFVERRAQVEATLPRLERHLRAGGMVWVSWPKGGSGNDLRLGTVIALGYDAGLVESKTVSIDATWSAIKFTRPKPGKTYRNSFGALPGQRRRGRAASA